MTPQTPLPPIRACIFDLDGLLINSEDIYTDIHNQILTSYSLPPLKWTTKALQQSRGPIGHERLISSTNLPLTVLQLRTELAQHHLPFKNSQPLPGVLPLLKNLSTAKPTVHLALASSTTYSFFSTKTSHLPDLRSYFAAGCCLFRDDADMVGKKGKPAGDIFLLAMERINSSLNPTFSETVGSDSDDRSKGEMQPLHANECLVFEDSIAGVAAGRAAGMRVCWVPHAGLRAVCRGMEKEVLDGKMEEVEGRLLAIEEEGGEMGVESVSTTDVGKGDGAEKKERIVSDDGWAEMINSLEEFDYARYGIQIES
ncbi:MAG: hypothetical protein Q9180_004646 [Flavoplaca navasiana]